MGVAGGVWRSRAARLLNPDLCAFGHRFLPCSNAGLLFVDSGPRQRWCAELVKAGSLTVASVFWKYAGAFGLAAGAVL